MNWYGVPVTFREAFGRIAATDVLVDGSFVGTVWLAADGWRWDLAGSTTAGANCATRRRAIVALLAAYSTALNAWATP